MLQENAIADAGPGERSHRPNRGHVLQWTNGYMIPFFIAASAYLIALLIIHLLSPELEPAKIEQA
jgi:hypothetical protein